MTGQRITGTKGRQFDIIREIGRGGFGIVYLAKGNDNRDYALKTIISTTRSDAELSFKREVESTFDLSHNNLLSIIDYGSANINAAQVLFIASEYCPGGDYRDVFTKRGKNYPIDSIIDEFKQILSGLGYLHTRIVHRDLKPENILVVGNVLKIADFGLAKFVDEATKTLTFKGSGTPQYMAPEIWRGQHATAAADLYAIGVMLFEALTGRPPFEAEDTIALRDLHLYEPAPRAKSLNSSVPDVIDGLVKKLLDKDPAGRYQTASEVLKILELKKAEEPDPQVTRLAERIRSFHDGEEQKKIKDQRAMDAEHDELSRLRHKEQEIVDMIDSEIEKLKIQLPEIRISSRPKPNGKEYTLGQRTLVIEYFQLHDLFRSLKYQAMADTLYRHHVVHGGFIEIRESGTDREGWNIVLIREPGNLYGVWHIIETRINALVPRRAPFEPFATRAALFAENYHHHLGHAMHVYVLIDKILERNDILAILDRFVPST
jgi:serine/threonine protein kinase